MKYITIITFILIGWVSIYAYQHKQTPTVQNLCTKGYSASVRDVPVEKKKDIYARDGVTYEKGKYVVDHIIPLELGGSNSESNLQIQTITDGKTKDRIENLLHNRLCGSQISLEEAQREVLNWQTVK